MLRQSNPDPKHNLILSLTWCPDVSSIYEFIQRELKKKWRKKNQRIYLYATQTSSVTKQIICDKKITPKTVLFKRYLKTKKLFGIRGIREHSTIILPKKISSNIKPPSSNLTTTSNSFDLLSENTKNSLDTSNVISIEDNNAENYSNKSIKPSHTSILTGKKVNFRHNRKNQEQKKD